MIFFFLTPVLNIDHSLTKNQSSYPLWKCDTSLFFLGLNMPFQSVLCSHTEHVTLLLSTVKLER